MSSWTISDQWKRFQGSLFPWLEEEVGPLRRNHQRLVQVLDQICLAGLLRQGGVTGRPLECRVPFVRAFIAKAVWDIPTTRGLIDRLHCDPVLRRLCGWESTRRLPSEATFSRVFDEFAQDRVPERLHEHLVATTLEGEIIGHISRDSTAIEAREKAKRKDKEKKPRRKRGRPRKGEERPKEPKRLERQLHHEDVTAMIADLPRDCDVGTKRNAKGFMVSWKGYKLHIDAADGGIPISCILTSASLHDSQVAIPLSRLSTGRTTYLYEIMDAAYDSDEIGFHAYLQGHVAITDVNTRRDTQLKEDRAREAWAQRCAGHVDPQTLRTNERSTVERVNGLLKDAYGGRHVRVRGHGKVMAHLMYGVLVLTVDQLMRLTI